MAENGVAHFRLRAADNNLATAMTAISRDPDNYPHAPGRAQQPHQLRGGRFRMEALPIEAPPEFFAQNLSHFHTPGRLLFRILLFRHAVAAWMALAVGPRAVPLSWEFLLREHLVQTQDLHWQVVCTGLGA